MYNWVKKWEVQGSKSVWIVSQDDEGNYGCSCPVWKFKLTEGKRTECKHIKKIKLENQEE